MARFAKMNICLAITGLLLLVFLSHGNAGEAPAAEALPERIVLNMTRSPHDSLAVTWRTREKGTTPTAQIVPLSGLVNLEKGGSTFQADTCQVELDDGKAPFHPAGQWSPGP
ncbi:MAG: hypothetical protein R6U27_06185 [Desulfobacterales bacterium]